jgi:hypothetical protein
MQLNYWRGGALSLSDSWYVEIPKSNPLKQHWTFRRQKKFVVDSVLPDQTVDQLYVPKTKNYAAIDAWIPGIGAFQMTVGKNHDIKTGAKDDLAMLGGGNKSVPRQQDKREQQRQQQQNTMLFWWIS